MGNSVLRGISAALLVTVITLLAGMFWSAMGFGGLSASGFVDIGLVASCITAGYRTGKETGHWFLGGVAALGYVGLSILLVAIFLPVSRWGALQILLEGIIIGIVAGGFGAGKSLGENIRKEVWTRTGRSVGYSPGNSFYHNEDREWEQRDKRINRKAGEDWDSGIQWEDKKVDARSEPGFTGEDEWEQWMGSSEKAEQDKPRDEFHELKKPAVQKRIKDKDKAAWWEEDAGSYRIW